MFCEYRDDLVGNAVKIIKKKLLYNIMNKHPL